MNGRERVAEKEGELRTVVRGNYWRRSSGMNTMERRRNQR